MARQRRSYEQAVACCLTSPWAADSVIRDYGIAPAKVHVVGVGRNHTAPADERDWSRPRFLFVGMDWARKNGAGVLAAFARLRDELPGAQLDLVGAHPPVDAPGVTGHGVLRLDVPEQHERLERLFAEATCFVMPSHSEASAIAYVEAAAAGPAEHRHVSRRLGLPDRRRRAGRGPARRRRPARRDATARRPGARQRGWGPPRRRRSELFTWGPSARRLLRALDGAPPSRSPRSLSRAAAAAARRRRAAPPGGRGARRGARAAARACVASPSATPSAWTRAPAGPRCLRA